MLPYSLFGSQGNTWNGSTGYLIVALSGAAFLIFVVNWYWLRLMSMGMTKTVDVNVFNCISPKLPLLIFVVQLVVIGAGARQYDINRAPLPSKIAHG